MSLSSLVNHLKRKAGWTDEPTVSSSFKRVKQEEPSDEPTEVEPKVNIEQNVAEPQVEQDAQPTLPIITDIPLNWIKYTSPEDLQAILLEACAHSPSTNARVSQSVNEVAPLIQGSSSVRDFKRELSQIKNLVLHDSGDDWERIVNELDDIWVEPSAPLLSKLNALKARLEATTYILDDLYAQRGGEEYQHGQNPYKFWRGLVSILRSMTEEERRTHVDGDADLVAKLDAQIRTKSARRLYGPIGREVGAEVEQWDMKDGAEDKFSDTGDENEESEEEEDEE